MKLSELSTDRSADVLCELAPYIGSITDDREFVKTIGKVVTADEPMNQYGNYAMIAGRIIESIPLLLKKHRADVYGILSVMNERSVKEIAEQKLIETMRQVRELFDDEVFEDFFKSSVQRGQTKQSVPSAASPTLE